MTSRTQAITSASSSEIVRERECVDPNSVFGLKVFHEEIQKQVLSPEQFKALQKVINHGEELSRELADQVAFAIKEWALFHKATHFCHWFQPLTDLTAEKHDALYRYDGGVSYIADFGGDLLIRGEPDASSFPTGGLRATFEARGYTSWDPSSPPFIMGNTLIIPSCFISYTGEALDKKTPLLRALDALNRQAVKLLHLLGDKEVSRVTMTVGSEQEYFLIDKRFFYLRPDLVSTGRTVFGAPSIKGQELQDQYLGTIPARVMALMEDVEHDLLTLGIPVMTRHNEVAPGQYEFASHYESANLAVDHQMLTMEVLRKSASRHNLACLLHEKPFKGVNGSGKHLNWSLATDLGTNLLEPGETPQDNAKFLIFCAAVLLAVHDHSPLFLASIASAGNDHRLGQHEAPPAILSVFLGEQLFKVFHALATGEKLEGVRGGELIAGVSLLPKIPKHTSDRNRTSPFAFTGNKFEFRAPGSATNVAEPCTMFAATVAKSLETFVERLEKADDVTKELNVLLADVAKKVAPILFEGDNYGEAWLEEASKRGLPIVPDTVEAAMCLKKDQLLPQLKVLNRREIEARVAIMLDKYTSKIKMEAKAASTLAHTAVLPAAIRYFNEVSKAAEHFKSRTFDHLSSLGEEISSCSSALDQLDHSLSIIVESSGEDAAYAAREHLLPAMNALREHVDRLEELTDDTLWQLPKYQEMLFIR